MVLIARGCGYGWSIPSSANHPMPRGSWLQLVTMTTSIDSGHSISKILNKSEFLSVLLPESLGPCSAGGSLWLARTAEQPRAGCLPQQNCRSSGVRTGTFLVSMELTEEACGWLLPHSREGNAVWRPSRWQCATFTAKSQFFRQSRNSILNILLYLSPG